MFGIILLRFHGKTFSMCVQQRYIHAFSVYILLLSLLLLLFTKPLYSTFHENRERASKQGRERETEKARKKEKDILYIHSEIFLVGIKSRMLVILSFIFCVYSFFSCCFFFKILLKDEKKINMHGNIPEVLWTFTYKYTHRHTRINTHMCECTYTHTHTTFVYQQLTQHIYLFRTQTISQSHQASL